ncbi:MAG: cytochrome b N-terminal domain-containing protein [Candidatus Sericytochromatia bacterium]|nr:cytochrome b N-terminal domain-containing protein [Candidatus Sericytochromatia bacterium]
MVGKVFEWLDLRLGVRDIDAALVSRNVPKIDWWYTLGFAALFTFIIMAVSGMFLAVYYAPTPDHAYDSVKFLTEEITGGKVVRGLHHYGASAMVVIVTMHMLQVFFYGAYKYPRELTWMSGVGLLGLVLGLGFTGYLLPWDQKAYWATEVGTKVPESIPIVGDFSKKLLRGGETLGALTLTRFYAIHMLMIPALMLVFLGIHLYLVIKIGITPLPEKLDEAYDRVKGGK